MNFRQHSPCTFSLTKDTYDSHCHKSHGPCYSPLIIRSRVTQGKQYMETIQPTEKYFITIYSSPLFQSDVNIALDWLSVRFGWRNTQRACPRLVYTSLTEPTLKHRALFNIVSESHPEVCVWGELSLGRCWAGCHD